MSNVIPLREGFAPSETIQEPVESVVRFLEGLLERARSGDIIAVAAAYQHRDGAVSDFDTGGVSCALLGALECRRARMVAAMIEAENTIRYTP